VLRRSAGTRTLGALDGNLQVPARSQAVEVVAGHVGMQTELSSHVGRGHAALGGARGAVADDTRLNILFVFADDWGRYAS
jgi:hypothetical protein